MNTDPDSGLNLNLNRRQGWKRFLRTNTLAYFDKQTLSNIAVRSAVSDDDSDDDERTIRQRTESPPTQSSPSQSFYASFKIYINRLSGRFNDDATRVSARSGDDASASAQENEPRVVVRIEELDSRRRSDESGESDNDDDVFQKSSVHPAKAQPSKSHPAKSDPVNINPVNTHPVNIYPVKDQSETQNLRSDRISPPKHNLVPGTRDDREESPVFYLDPVDWVRVEGSSPLPVNLPVVAQEPAPIPEVTISPTRRKSSTLEASQNNIAPSDQVNSKLLLSPPNVSGCFGCSCRHSPETSNVVKVGIDEQTNKRLRSKSYGSAHHMSAVSTLQEEHRNVVRTTSSGSYLSTAARRERMTTTETLLSRNRRRKVAIPILCARAAAMVRSYFLIHLLPVLGDEPLPSWAQFVEHKSQT